MVQYFALIDDMNVYRNVSLPLRYQGIPRAKIKQRTTKMLQHLGIEEKAKAYPGELVACVTRLKTGQANCPAGSSSGLRLPGRLSKMPELSWRTSPPGRWMRAPVMM